MANDTCSYSNLISFAHRLGDASATTILPYFRSDLAVDVKGPQDAAFDPVTEGDRAAEATIRGLIEEKFPNHAILGEEHGAKQTDSAYRWVIDPIDGTRAFILGLPTWGTLIGLEIDGKPRIGLMNQPFTGDRFWADGETAFYRCGTGDIRQIRTRASVSLADAQMACTHPDMFSADVEASVYQAATQATRSCRLGTDCFGYALLAAGLIDLVVEAHLQPYDIVALIPIIEQAGGVVTAWDGGEARHGGRVVAAANPTLHAEVLDLIANVTASATSP